jgi:hypothetical protein
MILYVYVDVTSGTAVPCKSYYTHHSNNTPLYVDYDVSSVYFYHWMFFGTHCSNMDAPQYVHVDVLSGNFYRWIFYCTHHSNMDAPLYVNDDVSSGYI